MIQLYGHLGTICIREGLLNQCELILALQNRQFITQPLILSSLRVSLQPCARYQSEPGTSGQVIDIWWAENCQAKLQKDLSCLYLSQTDCWTARGYAKWDLAAINPEKPWVSFFHIQAVLQRKCNWQHVVRYPGTKQPPNMRSIDRGILLTAVNKGKRQIHKLFWGQTKSWHDWHGVFGIQVILQSIIRPFFSCQNILKHLAFFDWKMKNVDFCDFSLP